MQKYGEEHGAIYSTMQAEVLCQYYREYRRTRGLLERPHPFLATRRARGVSTTRIEVHIV